MMRDAIDDTSSIQKMYAAWTSIHRILDECYIRRKATVETALHIKVCDALVGYSYRCYISIFFYHYLKLVKQKLSIRSSYVNTIRRILVVT